MNIVGFLLICQYIITCQRCCAAERKFQPHFVHLSSISDSFEATNLFMSTQCVFSMEMTSIIFQGDCKTLIQCSNGRTTFFGLMGISAMILVGELLKFRSIR